MAVRAAAAPCAVCVLRCVGFVIGMVLCCCCACCCCSPCCASAVQQNRKAPQAEYRKFAVVLSLATAKPQRIDAQGANISLQLLPNNLPSYGRVRWFNSSDLVGAPCSRNANQPRERGFFCSVAQVTDLQSCISTILDAYNKGYDIGKSSLVSSCPAAAGSACGAVYVQFCLSLPGETAGERRIARKALECPVQDSSCKCC